MAVGVGNPYVGPRPFTEADSENFFGRDRESESLAALISANRLTLFYAPSGAGKSSLIHAKLIPLLRREEQFTILPVARVGVGVGDRLVDGNANIYVRNLISWLEAGRTDNHHAAGHTADHPLEGHTDLAAYLHHHLADLAAQDTTVADLSPLLIIDQFEEILTSYPDRWQEREGFFRQLAEAMYAQESLWVLLSLREEYVGALERYAWLLPGKLRARFYMRRLNHQAALEAIARPAARHNRPFAQGVAARLVQDLAQIRVEGEGSATAPGEFVEPIQLQVVCQRLWENLEARPPGPITAEDLDLLGDVNQALAHFYDSAVAQVMADPAAHVSERKVRQWFGAKLITPAGTRGTVFQGATETEGLDNEIVAKFEELHLIRGEPRAGGKWYELVHDRFIEPIQEANRAWFQLHQSPITQAAHDWAADGRNPAKLYSGSLLADARAQLQAQPDQFTELEEEFIAASDAADQARRTQRRRIVTAIVTVVVLTMMVLSGLALREADRARDAQATAEAALSRVRAESLAAQARSVYALSPPRALLLVIEALGEREGTDPVQQIATVQTLRDLLGQTGGLPLVGHTDSVLAVAFSPQGDWLASASSDTTIRLWQAGQPTATQTLTQHTAFVNAIAFSPDGEQMASASGDGIVLLWDVTTGEVDEFSLGSPANALAYSPDGAQLAVAGADGMIYLWETVNNTAQATWPGHDGPVLAIAFSPDGNQLASAGADWMVRLWQTSDPQSEPRLLAGHSGNVNALAFHPHDDWLASGGDNGEVRLWDLNTEETVQQFYQEQPVWAVAFTPDGLGLVTGSNDNVLRWWEDFADPAARPRLLYGHEAAIRALVFDPASGRLATGSSDETVRVWDLNSPVADPRVLRGHTGSVNKVVFNNGGGLLASGGDDRVVRLWQLDGPDITFEELGQQEQPIWSLAFSPDDRYLANTAGNRVRVRAVATGEELLSLDAAEDNLNIIAFSRQGEWLAAAGAEGIIRLWRVADLAADPELLPRHHSGAIWSLAFAPGGERLASAGEDGQILLWDPANPAAEPQPLLGGEGPLWSVAFSPDGRWLAAAGSDTNIRLWNAHDFTGQPAVLAGHDGPVWYVAFSADSRRLASAGGDQVVRLWDMLQPDARPIVLQGHTDPVNGVVFHPGGEWLASGSVDQTIRLWTLPVDSLVALACRVAGRNLSEEEWSQSFPNQNRRKTCDNLPLE